MSLARLVRGFILLIPFSVAVSKAQTLTSAVEVDLSKIPVSATFSGTVEWVAGSTKSSGTITLKVKADGSTEEQWNIDAVKHSYKQTALKGERSCEVTDAKAKVHTVTGQTCLLTVPWFAPWLAPQTVVDTLTSKQDITAEAEKMAGKQKVSYALLAEAPEKADKFQKAEVERLKRNSTVVITSDTKTLLPSRMDYQDAFGSDPRSAFQIYILYTDYQLEAGTLMPHRIQRYVQGSLQADIRLNSIVLNQ